MNVLAKRVIRAALRVTIFVGVTAVTIFGGAATLNKVSADSDSPFYNGASTRTMPVTFHGLERSVYFTANGSDSDTSNYGSNDGYMKYGGDFTYPEQATLSIIDQDKFTGGLTAHYKIYNPTDKAVNIVDTFELPKHNSSSTITLASYDFHEVKDGFTPKAGYETGPQLSTSNITYYTLEQYKANSYVSMDKVSDLQIQGTLAPKGTYEISVSLNVGKVDVNEDDYFLAGDYAQYNDDQGNPIDYSSTETNARFAKKIDFSGSFLPTTRNTDGSFTPISDIQSVMPLIANNDAVRFDDFGAYLNTDITSDNQAKAFDSLDKVAYTGPNLKYYIDLTKLKDTSGGSLLETLKKNYGYTTETDSNAQPITFYRYGYPGAAKFTQGGSAVEPLGKNGAGDMYIVLSKIPGWVKPAGNNGGGSSNSGSGSSGASTVTSSGNNTSSSTTSSSSTPSSSTNSVTVTESNLPNYAAVKGSAVYSVKKIYMYRNATFKKAQRIVTYPKAKRTNRPMFVITGYARSSNGALRYKVRDVNHGRKSAGKVGYITANSKYVVNVYYKTMPKNKKITVIAKSVHAYKSESLTGRVKTYKKGARLTVKKIVKHNLTTRYQLSNGDYVTANKKLVIQGNY